MGQCDAVGRSVYNRKSKWERLCRRFVDWKSSRTGAKIHFEIVEMRDRDFRTYMVVAFDGTTGNTFGRDGGTRIDAVRNFILLLMSGDFPWPSSRKPSYRELVLEIEARGF